MTEIDAGEVTPAERCLDRADIFRAAYALVMAHSWTGNPEVNDVVRVAEFLADGERY
jgi:hypothetical protein